MPARSNPLAEISPLVHRVFDSSEIACRCVLEIADSGLIRADVKRISRIDVLLDTPLRFDADHLMEVIVEFPDAESMVLPAKVTSSGDEGLELHWRFFDPAEPERLEDFLIVNARGAAPGATTVNLEATQLLDPSDFEEMERQKAHGQGPERPTPTARASAQRISHSSTTGKKARVDSPPHDEVDDSEPLELENPAPSKVMIDGQLDVEATLRSRATHVAPSKLAQLYDNVRVLRLSSITGLIQEAVEEAADTIERNLSEKERERLLEETERVFAERLSEFQSQKADLRARVSDLESQLQRAQSVLEEERLKEISRERFMVSDAGIQELETRLGRLFDQAVRQGGLDGDTESAMREVVGRLLDDERDRIQAQAQQAQSDRIGLLERKVSRLSRSLDETRQQRDHAQRLAAQLDADGSVQNMYTPGLQEEDPLKAEKLALLQELVTENQEVRKHVKK